MSDTENNSKWICAYDDGWGEWSRTYTNSYHGQLCNGDKCYGDRCLNNIGYIWNQKKVMY